MTSFLTVGSVWIAHHNLFTRLKYVDAALLRINMLLLMAAAFLPFPTGVLAEALNASNTAAYPVAIAFGIVAFPKVAAVGYLVVAAEGVLLLGGRPRFSLRKLLSRA